jgi:hypothetical protein
MKIYSKFIDYYDHVTGYYSNDSTWIRKIKMYNIKKNKFNTPYSNEIEKIFQNMWYNLPSLKSNNNNNLIIIGFCGKIYLAISKYDNSGFLIGYYINKISKDLFRNFINHDYFEWKQRYENNLNLINIFIEINSPIFIIKNEFLGYTLSKRCYSGYNLIINPCLRDFKLQCSFDPFTAHQEIEMFLNNQLVINQDSNIDMTDDLIRDSKGFDKYSFKQHGPKKRKRKK